jgi:hypothetical protein
MDFEDNLRFVLSTAEQLPTHIHLSEFDYKFMEGKRERKESKTLRFRKLTENELGQLLRRLQDTPQQQHVIGFNIWGNKIGPYGCSALSQAQPHLSALQELNLRGNLILLILFCLFGLVYWGRMCGRRRGCEVSHAAGNSIGPSGCSALSQALPHLSALQELNLQGNLIL